MSTYPAFIGRGFDQIWFVVDDLEAAVDHWRRVNGIDVWDVVIDLARPQVEKEIWGRPGDFQFSCAYGMAGTTLIELARHDGGESIYADWRGGPHHIGFRLGDADEFGAACGHYAAVGIERAMAGYFDDGMMGCRWAYYDTRSTIGCFTELYYLEGEAIERFRKFASGESKLLIS